MKKVRPKRLTKDERDLHYKRFRLMYERVRSGNQFKDFRDLKLLDYVKENPRDKNAFDEFYYRKHLWDSKQGRADLGDEPEV